LLGKTHQYAGEYEERKQPYACHIAAGEQRDRSTDDKRERQARPAQQLPTMVLHMQYSLLCQSQHWNRLPAPLQVFQQVPLALQQPM
jgi:hypothetical protein